MVLLYISIASPLIPLIAGYKNRRTLLWLYVLTGLLFDIAIPTMKRVLHVNYDWASNLFVLVEFFFLSFYYRDKIFRNKTVFYTVLATLSTFFVVQTLRADKSIWHFNTYGSCVFCLTYIIYCILGMYALLKEQKVIFLDRSPLFWVNVGFILYSSGSFLLFLFKIYLQETDMALLRTLWTAFFLPCNILKNIALAIGLRKKNAL